MSSAYHPQTNGQTERTNQCLEQYIRCYCTHLQDDWLDLLPVAEFSYNNATSSSTNQSPFLSNYGFHPSPLSPDFVHTNIPATESYFARLQQTSRFLRDNILAAQARQKHYYDQRRTTPPPLKIGDSVWLSTKNLRLKTPSRKFSKLFIGPYPIDKIVNAVTYRLTLPPSLKIHPTFHVALLKPYRPNTFPQRSPCPPPPVLVQGEPEYEIERILDSRRHRNSLQYLIRWKNYSPQDDSWENASDVHASRLIRGFHLRYPDKPGPQRTPGVGPWRGGSVTLGAVCLRVPPTSRSDVTRLRLPHTLTALNGAMFKPSASFNPVDADGLPLRRAVRFLYLRGLATSSTQWAQFQAGIPRSPRSRDLFNPVTSTPGKHPCSPGSQKG